MHFLMRCRLHNAAREPLLAVLNQHRLPATFVTLLAGDTRDIDDASAAALDSAVRVFLTTSGRFRT